MIRIVNDAEQLDGETRFRAGGPKARAVAVAGVAASVGAFGAAEAHASGKIFACYSKSTKVLTHAKSSHCKPGFKSQSWNKAGLQGPQGARGAQGAQGAQGPAGAVAGYDKYHASTTQSITHGTSAVVASFAPAAAGNYAVNGFADGFDAGTPQTSLKCGITNLHHTSATPAGGGVILSDQYGPAPTTGIVHGSAASPIEMVCKAGSGHNVAIVAGHAAMTGVQLATANGHATALHQQAINNRFAH